MHTHVNIRHTLKFVSCKALCCRSRTLSCSCFMPRSLFVLSGVVACVVAINSEMTFKWWLKNCVMKDTRVQELLTADFNLERKANPNETQFSVDPLNNRSLFRWKWLRTVDWKMEFTNLHYWICRVEGIEGIQREHL